MAFGDPIDEFSAYEPWSWLPKDWETNPPGAAAPALPPLVEEAVALETAPPIPPPPEAPGYTPPPLPGDAPMQPGLGLPQSALAGVQPEIEMPAEYVGKGPKQAPDLTGVGKFAEQVAAIPDEEPSPFEGESPFFDAMDPSKWGNALGSADLYQLAKSDPIAYAKYNLASEQARVDQERDLVKQADADFAKQREQTHRERMDVINESEARRKALLDVQIDPGRHQRNMSVPQTIASYISVIVGGLVQSRKGGPNIGLEMLDKAIERDIAAQQADISNQRNAIADFERTGMSRIEAVEAYRIGSYKQALAGIQTKMQDFDKAGTTARNLTQQALEIEGRMAQSAEAARRGWVDEQLKLREDERKTAETMAKLRKTDAEIAKMRGGVGGGAGASDKVVRPVAYFKSTYPGSPVPPRDMSEKEYRSWLSTTRSGAEASQALGAETPEQKRTREFGINGPDGKPLLNEKGEQVEGRDIGEANKLTEQIANTDEVIRMMDEVLRLRKEHGWSSDLFKSPEWRKMKANWAGVILKKKNIDELGVIAGPDMELMGDALGATDPTSLRDPTAGIEQGRQNAVQGLYGRLRIKGVSDKSMPQYPETWKKQKPRATAVDSSIKEAIKAETFDELKPTAAQIGSPSHEAIMKNQAAKTERAVTSIRYLADAARGEGSEAQKARAGLGEVASKATSPRVREMAATELRNIVASEAASQEVPK